MKQPHTTVQAGNWLARRQLCRKRGVYPISDVCASDGRRVEYEWAVCLCGEEVYPHAGLDLIIVFNYQNWRYRGNTLFSGACSRRWNSNARKLQQGKFQSDTRKKKYSQWHWLCTGTVCLEMLWIFHSLEITSHGWTRPWTTCPGFEVTPALSTGCPRRLPPWEVRSNLSYSLITLIFLDYVQCIVDVPELVLDDSVWEQMVPLW